MRLHLFNPENDLALGAGCKHYTPPPRVVSLHRAGALMPVWWAGDDDFILAPSVVSEDLEFVRRRYGLQPQVGNSGVPSPWGWSLDARRQFAEAGVGGDRLPSVTEVDRMRSLSHRRTSGEILSALGEPVSAGREVTDAAVVMEMSTGPLFLKSPWSCSGRGVFSSRGLSARVLHDRAQGIINRQGSVMVEKEYDRVRDFAALFESGSGRVRHVGWSVFETGGQGAYTGNLVAPQGMLRGMIGCDVDVERICEILTEIIAPHYTGPLGIDMMIYRDSDGREALHPCVELNLRMTMGFVAMAIEKRLCAPHPLIVGWEYGDHAGTPLLLPKDGFALTLRER